MRNRTTAVLLCLGVVFCGGPIGCGRKPPTKEEPKPECRVLFPQYRNNIQDYVEYTGRTAAVASVDVKARVTGFLLEVKFTEGAEVKKDQELFLIDPVPYDAQLEQAQAQVGLYTAQVELSTTTYDQAKKVAEKNPKTFSELQLRTYEAQKKVAEAGLKAAKASLKIYELNKKYTTVTAPISGVVGRKNVTPGNVILQDQTLLTTVVNLDTIYVYFDMDAPTATKFQQTQSARGAVFLEVPSNQPAPSGDQTSSSVQTPRVQGDVDFFNNQYNPTTDTILVRGVFPNSKKPGGAAAAAGGGAAALLSRPRLRPGMFVRVRLPIGEPYGALLVLDRAILSKMGKKYVYVVDADSRVKEIPVVIGQLQENGLRVIKSGQLTEKDRVVVSHLLDIQPRQEIQPVGPPTGKTKDAGGSR